VAVPILTSEESEALDRASEQRGVHVRDLMENAGWAVARAVTEVMGGGYGRRVVVVCGKGNNGGDGLVAARHLHRWGCRVTALLMGGRGDVHGPVELNLRRLIDGGGDTRRYTRAALDRELGRADVAVDSMVGTGFQGIPKPEVAGAIVALNGSDAAVVAVDIPSGVEGETGAVRAQAVQAEATVTFGALKPGLVFPPGAWLAGEVEVVDIGFPKDLVRSDLVLVEAGDVARLLPVRAGDTHKRATGVVMVLAGSRTMTGAAALAGSAAYGAGAGLVTLAVPGSILPVVQGSVAEATFLALPETEAGTVAEGAWTVLEERLHDVDVVAAGPGLTTDPSTADLVRRLVAESPVPVVLDADGLNAFAGRGAELADHRSSLVITPHAGEFGRLMGVRSGEVAEDRVGLVRKASSEFGCIVLLKGSRTVVCEPGGRVTVNPTGGPALATGGTGDVLTGALAAILARGLEPADAAMVAAFVHGAAGKLAGAELGEGTVASDVLGRLPRAIEGIRRSAVP
jgi:ADP-dependent NAD(P)H-hydrate dehydratase / NAD(P)H-hydrate epimerase